MHYTEYRTQNTKHTIKNIEYKYRTQNQRIQNTEQYRLQNNIQCCAVLSSYPICFRVLLLYLYMGKYKYRGAMWKCACKSSMTRNLLAAAILQIWNYRLFVSPCLTCQYDIILWIVQVTNISTDTWHISWTITSRTWWWTRWPWSPWLRWTRWPRLW